MPGPLGSPPTAARHQPSFGSPCRRLRFPPSPGQPSTLALASMWHQPSGARTMPPRSLAAPVDLAEAADANRKRCQRVAPCLRATVATSAPGSRLSAAIRAFSASERTRRPVGPSRTSRRPPYPAVETSIWTFILSSTPTIASVAKLEASRTFNSTAVSGEQRGAYGCFGALGKVATAWWRDCSDDGRAIDAKRCFGKEDLADRVLSARNRSGLVVGQLWSRYCGNRSA